MRVFKNAWFGRFARKERISFDSLWDAVERADKGLIVIYRKEKKAFFVYGFPKSDLGNIRDDELEQFKKAAKSILALSEDQIRKLIEIGQFEEVMKDG